jgi:ligand-binding sensor domain-containing protein
LYKPIFIFLLFAFGLMQAQSPVVRLNATQDLGGLHFTTVYQDSHGWLWLGAENAVYRYDGQEFMPMKFPEKMESGPVNTLFESNGCLWVGFDNGMIAYLPNANSIIPVSTGDVEEDLRRAPTLIIWEPEEGLPTAPIKGILEDKSGAMWISTYGEGLYVWKNHRLFQFNQSDDGLASDDIYAMTLDPNGRIWVATDAGISICAMPEQGEKKVMNLTKSDGLPDEIITSLSTDNEGNIWGGTDEKGVFRYHFATNSINYVSPSWAYGAVSSLKSFGTSELWIGTKKHGIILLDIHTDAIGGMPKGHALKEVNVRAMCKDREGLLWVIVNQGILYSSNPRFTHHETPFSNIQAICTSANNQFWVGTSKGLYLRKPGGYVKLLPGEENIICLWESPLDGTIWAGTLGNGVFLIQQGGRSWRHLPERETKANSSVLSISGNKEKVWLATLDGVSTLDAKTLKPEKGVLQDQLAANYVYKVLTDTRGRVWFGTDGEGLVLYENGKFSAYTDVDGINLRTIYSIAEDRLGNIWFSTAGSGLFKFDGKVFKRYTTANHLHSMAITGLAVDGNNQVIIGYEDGFDMLNPARFDHINFCGAQAGAPKIAVNLNALWTDGQGHVWLGGQNGIVRSSAYREPMIDDPQPGITGVSVFLQALDFQQKNVFEYDQNNFLFNFIGLWYTDPESVRYRYRLDGFDPDWKISKDHTASYPRLPPGNYTFRVQTSEHGNFANVPEASWSFKIETPFWQRWWFIALIGAFSIGVLGAYVRAREARLKREDRLKRERVESQFETLKSQINPHFLFNSFNTLITIIEENPRIAVEYVEHLSDFYRSIIVYRERDFIKISEEMELVHSFHFLLKKRFEAGFHLVDRLNGAEGLVMPLSLQLLVENAVKHNIISVSKPLTIEIFMENNHIVVRNNIQRKIKPEASTQFGLHSLVNRYKLIGEGQISVEDNEAFFTVKLPVLR